MAKTIEELLEEANRVKEETKAGQNTANRIGSLFVDIINCMSSSLDVKQDTLVSGSNIKTINNESILGPGNINVGGGGTFVQEQADWSINDNTKVSFIKNKPDLSTKIDKSVYEVNKSSISDVNAFIVQECAKTSADNNYHHIVKVYADGEYSYINIFELVNSSNYKEYKVCGYLTADGTTLGFSESLLPTNYREYAIKINNGSFIAGCIPLIYNYSFNSETANLNIS